MVHTGRSSEAASQYAVVRPFLQIHEGGAPWEADSSERKESDFRLF